MTALKKYARLECPGLWRAAPDQQRRDVIVSLGSASLVLTDGRSDDALSHWSLPAVRRLNPGESPALYAPDVDSRDETLEIDEPAMIDAIETVRRVLAGRKARPGRLRLGVLAGMLAAAVGLGAFWLPGALVSHTAAVVPMAKRAEIGAAALVDMERLTGQPCTDPAGERALAMLAGRLFGDTPVRMFVLREGIRGALALPGRVVLLDRRLVEDHETPDVVAGHALAAFLRAEAHDPLIDVLAVAGVRATFRLLTSGAFSPDSVAGYGERRLRNPLPPVPPATLEAAFAAVRLPMHPYARSLGDATLLTLADGKAQAPDARPLLPDGDWISLQAICAR